MQKTVQAKISCGPRWLLDQIAYETGLAEDLREAFGKCWEDLLSLGEYSAMTAESDPAGYDEWATTHAHAGRPTMSASQIDGLLGELTPGRQEAFFGLRGRRSSTGEFWYREAMVARRTVTTAQGNLFGTVSVLSDRNTEELVAYTIRNTPDTELYPMEKLARRVTGNPMSHVALCLDPTTYRLPFVDQLLVDGETFVMGVPSNAHCARAMAREHDEEKTFPYAYDQETGLYIYTRKLEWPERDFRVDEELLPDDSFLVDQYLYYDVMLARAEQARIQRKLRHYRSEFATGLQKTGKNAGWREYFDEQVGPDGLPVFIEKKDELRERAERNGFYSLLSQGVGDAVEALKVYRMRRMTDLKGDSIRKQVETLGIDGSEPLHPVVFVDFLGLFFLFWLQKRLEDSKLAQIPMSVPEIFSELEGIRSWTTGSGKPRCSKPTRRQAYVFSQLGLRAADPGRK